jgi:hypothetical protein
MKIRNWWEITTPHKDIIDGRFDESIFAADLGNVMAGNAPVEYMDGAMFFEKTYLTKGLKGLLESVLLRTSEKGSGQSVIQLQTPFGGGKTHSLLGLYHLFKEGEKLSHIDTVNKVKSLSRIDNIPNVKVAAFIGTHANALSDKTPWGEIADQLGVYELMKKDDEARIAPGKAKILKMLEKAGTSLILMDELMEYVVKSDRAEEVQNRVMGQTLAFLQELTEAVATTKTSVLVLTLPASTQVYDANAIHSLNKLQTVSGRVESIVQPVEGVEIYEVIRKRLFDSLGATKDHALVAQQYFSLYHELGESVPAEFKTTEYRSKIEKAYPFHPELIDTLYERWGSFSTFQRTRGVLRLLALALGDLYEKRLPAGLIQSSMIPLDNSSVKREFIKHIGNEYDSVVAADIGEKGAKAPQIDREMGSEFAKQKIATSLATAVFLYSFSGSGRKGLNIRELRITILREGVPKTIVGDAVKKLEEELWYFHSSNGMYSFKNQANLNRVIVDCEDQITDDEVISELETILKKQVGNDCETFFWPKDPSDVPDTRKMKLVVMSPQMAHPSSMEEVFTDGIYTKAGSGYRVYKNGLVLLAIDDNTAVHLKQSIRRLLALELVQKTEINKHNIAKSDQVELSKKSKDERSKVPFLMHSTYRYLAHLTTEGPRWIDLGIPTVGSSSTFTSRAFEYMVDEELLLKKISPQVILRHTKLDDDGELKINNVFEMYLKTPGLPLLFNWESLYGGIRTGVSQGLFGLRLDNHVAFRESVFDIHGEMDILGKSKAESERPTKEEGTKPEAPKPGGEVKDSGSDETQEEKKPEPVRLTKSLVISSKVPWEKLSAIIGGVLAPLKEKDASIQLKLDIKAITETGFDRTTLDSRVKETLRQIGAEIEIWQED